MKYFCTNCNFTTNDASNWNKHKKTKKHLKNVLCCSDDGNSDDSNSDNSYINNYCNYNATYNKFNNINIRDVRDKKSNDIDSNDDMTSFTKCNHCYASFVSQVDLLHHLQTGCNKVVASLQKTNQALAKKLTKYEQNIKKLESDKITLLEDTVISLKEDKKIFAENSTTAMKFLTKNFQTTEPLTCMTNEKALELLTFNKSLDDVDIDAKVLKKMSKKEKELLVNNLCVEQMIHEHNNNRLHTYLTDIVVSEYLEDNPIYQQIWNTDKSRLSYIIREVINNKDEWIRDDKGHKIKKYVVFPILSTAKEMILIYAKSRNAMIMNDELPPNVDRETLLMRLATSALIIKNIKNKTLEDKIVTSMCSYFGISNAKKYINLKN
jgi:hypothetical protein